MHLVNQNIMQFKKIQEAKTITYAKRICVFIEL